MKRMLIMTALTVCVLSFTACTTSDNAGAGKNATAASATPAESSAEIEKALTQMERDWIEAGHKKDKATLERMMADDWVGITDEAKAFTRTESVANSLAADSQLESYTLDPLKVRVFGDTAIVTGGDTEKSRFKGKDTSGHYVWTDVFVKRNGRWQAVASHTSRFPPTKS